MMQPAQSLTDQPAQIIETGIVRRERAMSAHGVEWIVDPDATVAPFRDFLAGFAGAGETLRRRFEPFGRARSLPLA